MKKQLYIAIIFILTSCDNQECYIKEVYVNKLITLTNEDYADLKPNGNTIFIEGGNSGIIIYHFATNEYKAYDRNCSYNPCDECSYIDSVNTSIAYCGCCESAFLLDQNGQAANSPALLPLKQYKCILNGQILRIYN